MTQVAQPGGRRLDGVRAVVTGASSGIGAAIAEALGGAGAEVLVTHRDSAEGASAVAERIQRLGGSAQVAQADLGSRAGCEALVAQARERLGGLDLWVNNAGADVLTGEAADWDWERKLDLLLAVDLKGTIACSYAAGAVMREEPGARPGAPGPRQRALPGLDRDQVRAGSRPRLPPLGRGVHATRALGPAGGRRRGRALARVPGGGFRHGSGRQHQRRRCDVVPWKEAIVWRQR